MTTVTLEQIKEEHTKLSCLIAAFEKQIHETSQIHFPEALIELKPGEEYAGLILGKDGKESYHLVLLPGDAADINWTDAKVWAKAHGGELPTRREQALLYANLKEAFEERWHWSCEQHAAYSAYAWYQYFGDGYQYYGSTSSKLRARAVRRLTIQ